MGRTLDQIVAEYILYRDVWSRLGPISRGLFWIGLQYNLVYSGRELTLTAIQVFLPTARNFFAVMLKDRSSPLDPILYSQWTLKIRPHKSWQTNPNCWRMDLLCCIMPYWQKLMQMCHTLFYWMFHVCMRLFMISNSNNIVVNLIVSMFFLFFR